MRRQRRQRLYFVLFFLIVYRATVQFVAVVDENSPLPFKTESSTARVFTHPFSEQMFTAWKGTSSPCELKVAEEERTLNLRQAMKLCYRLPQCVSVSRNRLTGNTVLCSSTFRRRGNKFYELMPHLWSTSNIGGCHDVTVVERVALNLLPTCRFVGLDGYESTHDLSSSPCRAFWVGHTGSLQEAGVRCTSAAGALCSRFLRSTSGQTVLCAHDITWTRTAPAWTFVRPEGDKYFTSYVRNVHVTPSLSVDEKVSIPVRQTSIQIPISFGEFSYLPGMLECADGQILSEVLPISIDHASMLCKAEPYCTAFSYNLISGRTIMCQGYMKHLNSATFPSLVAFRSGFELYLGHVSLSEAQDGIVPSTNNFSSCPGKLSRVPVVIKTSLPLPKQFRCDECVPNGICPTLRAVGNVGVKFAEDLQKVNMALHGHGGDRNKDVSRFRAINPSVFKHDGRYFVAFRSTTASRCKGISNDGTWEVDYPLPRLESMIFVCELSNVFRIIQHSCFLVDAPTKGKQILHIDRGWDLSDRASTYRGMEDPRGFSFDGKMRILCNIGVTVKFYDRAAKKRFPGGRSTRQMLLITIDDKRRNQILHVRLPETTKGDTKNLSPLLSKSAGGNLLLVYSIFPYKICELDLDTGECEASSYPRETQYDKVIDSSGEELRSLGIWRGSSQFVEMSVGYLGVIHKHQDLELGRYYTHKWLLLDTRPPHQPIWLSHPFRFPSQFRGIRYDDIQFAAGLIVDEVSWTARISYGIADCESVLTKFHLPFEKGVGSLLQKFQLISPTISEVHPVTVQKSMQVRWEGQIREVSGFASATIRLWDGLRTYSDLFVRYVERRTSAEISDRLCEIQKFLVTSHSNNMLEPDVTVRFGWPFDFQLPLAGKLVIFLPWEFYAMPSAWVNMINANVDEVWTTCERQRRGMVDSGVMREVHVIPHGVRALYCEGTSVSTVDFSRSGRSSTLNLLYNCGLLWMNGLDLALELFSRTFQASDDVVLVINSIYGDPEVKKYVKRFSHTKKNVARLEVTGLSEDQELRSLYLRTDLLLHLSRTESFGMGILEAMSQGVPVMAPAIDPMSDIVTPDNGFLVPYDEKICDKHPCNVDGKHVFSVDWQVGDLFLLWHEVDAEYAGFILNEIYHNRELVEERRLEARHSACVYWGYEKAQIWVYSRLKQLSKMQQYANNH